MHDTDKTVAIICGASSWPRLERFTPAKAFRRTALGLKDYLTSETGLRLADDNVLDLFDSDCSAVEHFDRIEAFLRGHMRRTRSRHGRGMLVLVTYIGHGAFFEVQRFYCLLLRDTHEPAPVETSLRVSALSRTLKNTAPKSARIVILDSCFAAHAVNDFQSDVQQVADAKVEEVVEQEVVLDEAYEATAAEIDEALEQEVAREDGFGSGGVALLCASSSKDPAQLASQDSFTLFGRALLDVLCSGDPQQPGPMSLRQICRLIIKRLQPIKHAPQPQVHTPEQNGRDLADEPLFPNLGAGPLKPLRPGMSGRKKRLIGTAAGLVVTAVVGAGAAVGVTTIENHADFLRAHCDTDIESLHTAGDECIGLTDGAYDLFQPADRDQRVEDRIGLVEKTIRDQNQTAEQRHRDHPERPYVTLIDLEALTAPEGGTAAGLTAERESLEGLAVAQNRQLDAPGATAPIVRVLIGNAGRDMHYGPEVAAQVIDAAHKDPTIVGVIGLNLSNAATKNTVAELNDAHIPTVATTLSFDYLADWIPLFVQVAPQDRSEAATAAGFAAHLPTPKTARVYYSGDPNDLYSANLRDDATYWFKRLGFTVQATAFTPAGQGTESQRPEPGDRLIGDAGAAGADNCSGSGVAFFAARGVPDFGTFLDGASKCGGNDKTVIIGDDDVTRHVADTAARRRIADVPYYFMSFAPAPITDSEPGAAPEFYADLANLFTFENDDERSLDSHAALTYDAMQVYIAAVEQLRRTISGDVGLVALSRQITKIGTVQGVTGTFNYGGDVRPNVPKHKQISVLRVENGNVVPKIQAYCGEFPSRAQLPDAWCPGDADENPQTPPK
ncbi:hypothetical protein OG203_44130 [Nocardia sp. NBC_01499]|uniref:ABC transporter substrate-binding protein n=1 Tax=Nocardia sp. NBC_01499 TaxID=2903597 RepID=UPI00386440A0